MQELQFVIIIIIIIIIVVFLHYLHKYLILHKGTLQGKKNIGKINYTSSEKKMCAVTKVAKAFEFVTATDN